MQNRVHPLSGRILSRLSAAESEELNPWLRDDLRIARLTVAHAARGDARLCSPQVLASYEVLGLHPDKVWPAIQARSDALGLHFLEACDVPLALLRGAKKPPQSVKLWSENTNAVRVARSHGAETGSPRTSIPSMATASIAALYPNSDAPSSAKKRGFTYEEMLTIVEFSGAPHSVRQGTLSALKARGRWPNEQGPATGVICISLLGMQFHGVCCRSTARWRARRAVKLGFWRQLRSANAWSNCPKCEAKREVGKCDKCGYVGRAKTPDGKPNFEEFCRPYMYEVDIDKFRSAQRPKEIRHFDARTYAEYKEAAKRGDHSRNVTEMPTRKPAQPDPNPPPLPPVHTAPLKRPAAEHAHRSTATIGRDARQALFNAYIALKGAGKTHEDALAEVVRQFRNRFSPDDVEFALKIVGHKNGRDVMAEPTRTSVAPEMCSQCGTALVQNAGPGPRLKCPQCST